MIAAWLLKNSKPYIHTEKLRDFKNKIQLIDKDLEAELDLRKKITGNSNNMDLANMRDSSVMENENALLMA